MKRKEQIAICSLKLAGTLMTKGFVLLGVSKDNNGSYRNVFFFNDSPDLRKAISEYKACKKG